MSLSIWDFLCEGDEKLHVLNAPIIVDELEKHVCNQLGYDDEQDLLEIDISHDHKHEWMIVRHIRCRDRFDDTTHYLYNLPTLTLIKQCESSIYNGDSEDGIRIEFAAQNDISFNLCVLEIHHCYTYMEEKIEHEPLLSMNLFNELAYFHQFPREIFRIILEYGWV
jgi:hypothetical protein